MENLVNKIASKSKIAFKKISISKLKQRQIYENCFPSTRSSINYEKVKN